ncbi:hypothetical protein GCM10008942_41850 [Rhizomicrobium electricum]|uniref:Uncharacterized protein n=1 Tax=Rhizomicrobium electricum TaxID=480070 RepID=A0ABP3QGS0_9PROT|nr:hypothetical protein [Rhizomicrobium electricum]
MRPYYARAEQLEPKEGWGKSRISIFRGSEKIGEYERNYPALGESTFEPFERDGRWFALYSADYTCTRIMTLPDCRDIGGEQPASGGFCPAELYVPRYRTITWKFEGRTSESWHFEAGGEEANYFGPSGNTRKGVEVSFGPWQSLHLGFIAGCLWGDDSSWKLQVFDLSRAAEGIIERSERYGHLDIASDFPLVAAIQLYREVPGPLRATVLRQECRDMDTGKRIDPYTDEPVD